MSTTNELVSLIVFCHIFILLLHNRVSGEARAHYLERRSQILKEEWQVRTGSDIVLTKPEQRLNDIVMALKLQEVSSARQPGGVFPPALHFFKAKPLIEKSPVFKIIRAMPKGIVL